MSKLKGTKTERNLLESFAGESQARSRYVFFASVAKKEGYEQISAIFKETAENEKEHAETFFKFLEGGPLEITATFPAGKIGTTIENLEAAADGENEEWTKAYPEFARVAQEEGFNEIADHFKFIAKVEQAHEQRYRKLLDNIKNEKVFSRDTTVKWKCRNCGYVYESKDALEKCPACNHSKSYQELFMENY